MADIDLIPQDYRNQQTQLSVLRKYAASFGALNFLVVVVALVLSQSSKSVATEATELKMANAITQQQQAQLEQLQIQQAEYERQLGLLRGLRAGAAVDEIIAIVDRALNGRELWFLDWQFRRAGVVVNGEQRGIETGYFVIVDEDQKASDEEWQVETRMTIRGQAKDHEALSTFVRALFEQSEITDVKLQKTSATTYGNGRVVEFDMTISLNSTMREI